jgi:hypothetical protein
MINQGAKIRQKYRLGKGRCSFGKAWRFAKD